MLHFSVYKVVPSGVKWKWKSTSRLTTVVESESSIVIGSTPPSAFSVSATVSLLDDDDDDDDTKPPNVIINYQDSEERLLEIPEKESGNKRHVFNIQPIIEDDHPDSDSNDLEMSYIRRSVPVSIPIKETIFLCDDDDDDDDNDDENHNHIDDDGVSKSSSLGSRKRQLPESESKICNMRKRLCRHHEISKQITLVSGDGHCSNRS